VDALAGNDATALRGRSDRPWRTVSNAMWSAQSGDTVVIRPGNYTNQLHYTNGYGWAVNILNKTNMHVKAAGARLYGPGAGGHVVISNCVDCGFDDLTVIGNKPDTSAGAWIVNGLFAAVDPRACTRVKFFRPWIENAVNHGISNGDDVSCPRNFDVDVYNGYFRNIGATSGVPSISIDGAAFQPTGSDCDLIDSVITNAFRGYEFYSNVGDISGCQVRGNRFDYIHEKAVCNILPAAFLMRDCKIVDNGLTANPISYLNQGGIIMDNGVERLLIQGNSLSGFNTAIGLSSSAELYSRDCIVDANAITNSSSEAIRVFGGGTLHSTNHSGHTITRNVLEGGNIGATVSGLWHLFAFNRVSGFTTGLRSYHDGANGQTNLLIDICWNRFTHNGTHISLTSATVKTNRLIGNVFRHPQGSSAISDSGTGTQTNLNFH